MRLQIMLDRTLQLEIELPVIRIKATMDPISKLLNSSDSFPLEVDDVIGLFAERCSWIHAAL